YAGSGAIVKAGSSYYSLSINNSSTTVSVTVASVASSYTITPLPALGGNQSQAYGINDVGQVAGWATDGLGSQSQVIWRSNGGLYTPNNGVGSQDTYASGINNTGLVVTGGHTYTQPGGVTTQLISIQQGDGSVDGAFGVNSAGVVVGDLGNVSDNIAS